MVIVCPAFDKVATFQLATPLIMVYMATDFAIRLIDSNLRGIRA